MTPAAFVKAYRPAALRARALTGVRARVILAHWAIESGWGTSSLAVHGHNLAGIRFYGHPGTTNRDGFTSYPSLSAFVTDYGRTLNLSYYDHVRAAKSAADQIAALGASPWDAGHYGHPAGVHLLSTYHVLFSGKG